MLYTAEEIQNWETERQASDGTWIPGRPIHWKFESLISRLKNAWGVIRGDYDVLDWEDQE